MSNTYGSRLMLTGKIAEIDLEKRDVDVITSTPRGKSVLAKVHMWKVLGVDSDSQKHDKRANWKEDADFAVGNDIVIFGHMGNDGRIIATNYVQYPIQDEAVAEAEGVA